MTKPNEQRIELHMSNRSLASREEDQWIRKWVTYDEDIQSLAGWFKRFYATFNQIEAGKAKVAESPAAISLKPWKSKPFLPSLFKLAAQMPVIETFQSTLKTVKTFVSDEHKTILRILQDTGNNQLRLHVISNFVGSNDIVLLHVKTEDLLIASRPGGSFFIPEGDLSKETIDNWSACDLYLSLASIRLYKDKRTGDINYDSTEMVRERQELNLSHTHDELQVTCNFTDRLNPQKAVLYSDQQSHRFDLKAGACSIPLDKISGSDARLYFFDS